MIIKTQQYVKRCYKSGNHRYYKDDVTRDTVLKETWYFLFIPIYKRFTITHVAF
jgi:hypothetical protein